MYAADNATVTLHGRRDRPPGLETCIKACRVNRRMDKSVEVKFLQLAIS